MRQLIIFNFKITKNLPHIGACWTLIDNVVQEKRHFFIISFINFIIVYMEIAK